MRTKPIRFLLLVLAIASVAASCSDGLPLRSSEAADNNGDLVERLDPAASAGASEQARDLPTVLVEDAATLEALRSPPYDVEVSVDLSDELLHVVVTGQCGVPPEGPWLEVREKGIVLRVMDWQADYECAQEDRVLHVFRVDRSHRDLYPADIDTAFP